MSARFSAKPSLEEDEIDSGSFSGGSGFGDVLAVGGGDVFQVIMGFWDCIASSSLVAGVSRMFTLVSHALCGSQGVPIHIAYTAARE